MVVRYSPGKTGGLDVEPRSAAVAIATMAKEAWGPSAILYHLPAQNGREPHFRCFF